MLLKIVYLLTCRVLGVAVLVLRGDRAKDAEMLVLRHENAVLRLYRSKTSRVLSDLQGSWSCSRGSVVLVDHAAEHFPSPHGCFEGHDDRHVVVGWSLLAGLVRAMPVVMGGVLAED